MLKIWEAQPVSGSGRPGEILGTDKDSFTVACGSGAMKILSLQPEGKKRMETSAYLLGNKTESGMCLG